MCALPLALSEHPVLGDLFELRKDSCPFAEGYSILGFGLLVKKIITEQGYGLSFILPSVNLAKPGSVFTLFPDM